eukprot:Hpha_TRINITY_DN7394_c0_g1::TRINITY_DN7394_c0_g1_i1::g.10028::m.10028
MGESELLAVINRMLRRVCGTSGGDLRDIDELTSLVTLPEDWACLADVMRALYAQELVKLIYRTDSLLDPDADVDKIIMDTARGECMKNVKERDIDTGLRRLYLHREELPAPPIQRQFSSVIVNDQPATLAQSCGLLFSAKYINQFMPPARGVRTGGMMLYDIRFVFADAMWAQRFFDEGVDYLAERGNCLVEIKELQDGPRINAGSRVFVTQGGIHMHGMPECVCFLFRIKHVLCKIFIVASGATAEGTAHLARTAADRVIAWASAPENQPGNFRPQRDLPAVTQNFYPVFQAARFRDSRAYDAKRQSEDMLIRSRKAEVREFMVRLWSGAKFPQREDGQGQQATSDAPGDAAAPPLPVAPAPVAPEPAEPAPAEPVSSAEAASAAFAAPVAPAVPAAPAAAGGAAVDSAGMDGRPADGPSKSARRRARKKRAKREQQQVQEAAEVAVDPLAQLCASFVKMGFLATDVEAALQTGAKDEWELFSAIEAKQSLDTECPICFLHYAESRSRRVRPCCRQSICAVCEKASCRGPNGCAFCRTVLSS